MAEYGSELSFPWEGPALTRADIVKQYARLERHQDRLTRERAGRGAWTDRVPLPDGRVEVRVYEHGRLVSVTRVQPVSSPDVHPLRGVFATRLA